MTFKMITGIMLTLLLTSILAFDIQTVKAEPEIPIPLGTTDFVESSLDPAQAYDDFGWDIIRNIGCGLVDIRPGSPAGSEDIIPSLATDWSVSADGLEWTFNLRQGVEFDDGTEFNATHVKYSFDRGISLAAPDGPFVGIGYSDIIDSIEATSRYQVRFHLKIQFSPFLSLMANPPAFIVNPSYAPLDKTVDYVDGNARASSPLDLGPYILTKWVRSAGKDIEMKLDANPLYWNASGGYPKTGSVAINFYSNSTALRQAVESGEVAAVLRRLEIEDILDLKANPNLRAWEGPGDLIQYMVFQEKIAPFNDSRIRRAVGASINRTAVVSTVFLGEAIPLYSMIPSEMATHAEAFGLLGDANYTYAREVLGELGYSETNKLVIELWYETSGHYPQSADQVVVLKDSLEASGVIEVRLNGLDWAAYRLKRSEETMPAYIYGWYPDYVDPDAYLYPLLHSSGSSWLHNNYANPQMDTLIENARATTNATERNQLYAQVQSLMVEDCPVVPVFQSKAWTVTKPDIKGIYLDITQSQRLWLLQVEEVASRTWIVDDDGPADFSMIQDAINNAHDGDTIFVRSGTYYENVTVNKAVSLVGQNRETTIIHATRTGRPLIELAHGVNGVVIKGFTLEFPEEGWNNWAIAGAGVANSVIEENIIADSTFGMGAPGLTHGIYLVYYSANNTIRRNVISNVGDTSIYFDNSGGGNEVYENTIEGSGFYGVQIQGSSQKGPDKFYHNNFINNYHQVYIYDPLGVVRDVWDDGYPSGGNYWSDYTGIDLKSHPNHDVPGSDGIGDTPYRIDFSDRDRYPLMKPYTTPDGIRDVAVLNVTPCIRAIWMGSSVNINVTVKNNGDCADNRTVTVYYDSNLIGTQTVTLAPRENVILTFTWDTTNAVPGTHTVKAVASMVLAEANMTDNVLIDGEVRIRILGDVDGDNKTDIKDIALAALAFGSYAYPVISPGWNPDADINGDGTIDIRDLALVARHFGETYS